MAPLAGLALALAPALVGGALAYVPPRAPASLSSGPALLCRQRPRCSPSCKLVRTKPETGCEVELGDFSEGAPAEVAPAAAPAPAPDPSTLDVGGHLSWVDDGSAADVVVDTGCEVETSNPAEEVAPAAAAAAPAPSTLDVGGHLAWEDIPPQPVSARGFDPQALPAMYHPSASARGWDAQSMPSPSMYVERHPAFVAMASPDVTFADVDLRLPVAPWPSVPTAWVGRAVSRLRAQAVRAALLVVEAYLSVWSAFAICCRVAERAAAWRHTPAQRSPRPWSRVNLPAPPSAA